MVESNTNLFSITCPGKRSFLVSSNCRLLTNLKVKTLPSVCFRFANLFEMHILTLLMSIPFVSFCSVCCRLTWLHEPMVDSNQSGVKSLLHRSVFGSLEHMPPTNIALNMNCIIASNARVQNFADRLAAESCTSAKERLFPLFCTKKMRERRNLACVRQAQQCQVTLLHDAKPAESSKKQCLGEGLHLSNLASQPEPGNSPPVLSPD